MMEAKVKTQTKNKAIFECNVWVYNKTGNFSLSPPSLAPYLQGEDGRGG